MQCNVDYNYKLGDIKKISTGMPTEICKDEANCTFDFPNFANGPSNVPDVTHSDVVPTTLTVDPV